MRNRPVTTLLLVALFAVAGIGLLWWKLSDAGVSVIVWNATGGDITDLRVKFTGGVQSFPGVKSGGAFETRLNPVGESDIDVEFADTSGKRHSVKIDIYLERNYSGSIRATLTSGGGVTWFDNL